MELVALYKIQIIESVALLILYILLWQIFNKAVIKSAIKYDYRKSRIKVFKKVFSIILTVISIVLLLIIWGVNQSRIFFFISSFLTVLGIAFFAQWSILSNITAMVIIYFNHPVKIGDEISIEEKDSLVEGRISDIGMFFIIIKTEEHEVVTIPNNVFIQKAIKKKRVG